MTPGMPPVSLPGMNRHPRPSLTAVAVAVALLVPAAVQAQTRRVVGNGTPKSCTSARVVAAVARGGLITFDCGAKPVVIRMAATAKVRNTSPTVVIDGGGTVTLSGQGRRRILYQNTCDRAQVWTTSHCNDQATPRLIVRNITLHSGNSTGQTTDGGGGGAVFVRGGRLQVSNVRFQANRCDPDGPDVGGAAIRVLDQYHALPVLVTGSTFTGGRCANGAAISSIGVSWRIRTSTFRDNRATGRGANPARGGTPGGGNGGAVYLDGNRFTILLDRSTMEDNVAREGGGAIFFVSNNRTGQATITGSTLRRNPSLGFETMPGIFYLGNAPRPTVRTSTIAR